MKKPLPVHPFLFAVHPVLALFAGNLTRLSADQVLRPLVLVPLSAGLLFFPLGAALKDWKRAALIVSWLLIWFFSYGHFAPFFFLLTDYAEWTLRGLTLGTRDLYFMFSFLGLLAGVFLIARAREDLAPATKILNAASAFLVLFVLIQIGTFKIQSASPENPAAAQDSAPLPGAIQTGPGALPNIYCIILDAYARADVLRELYDYDNSAFIGALRQKGFYVADQSRANYGQTVLSLAALLNLDYLDDLVSKVGEENPDRKWAAERMHDSLVFQFLKRHGYTTVTFDAVGGWEHVTITTADRFYDFKEGALNYFENTLLNNTPVPFLLDRFGHLAGGETLSPAYAAHRKKILGTFQTVEKLSRETGPLFVFAHLLLPHQPFIFAENGSAVKPDVEEFTLWSWDPRFRKNFTENYKRQVRFTEGRVLEMLGKILARSPQPPLIILMADHGPEWMLDTEDPEKTSMKERMSILNAYFLPGYAPQNLYPSMTPVNTFRIIFDHYFGTDYGLLEDKSFFSTWSKPYRFIDVTAESAA